MIAALSEFDNGTHPTGRPVDTVNSTEYSIFYYSSHPEFFISQPDISIFFYLSANMKLIRKDTIWYLDVKF